MHLRSHETVSRSMAGQTPPASRAFPQVDGHELVKLLFYQTVQTQHSARTAADRSQPQQQQSMRVPGVTCTQRESVSLNQYVADVYQCLFSCSSSSSIMHVATQLAQQCSSFPAMWYGCSPSPFLPCQAAHCLPPHILPKSHQEVTPATQALPNIFI
jgi:hypothetical protein